MEESKKHVQVPDPVTGSSLKPIDRLVFANIKRFENKETHTCYPSMATIAKLCNVESKTIQRSIRKLVKENMLEILPEKQGRNNIYKFPKLNKDFEQFSEKFLDKEDLTTEEKAYLVSLQSQCYKDGNLAITRYTNKELSQSLNISENSITKYNRALKRKNIMQELWASTFNEDGFKNVIRTIDLQMIGQEFLIKVAINHEDRLQQLESQNKRLMQEIAELKKENAERKNQSYGM